MFEISPGRYIVGSRIVGCRIYTKDNKTKVAISLDTQNPEERTVYSGEMQNDEQAKQFVQNLSNSIK